MKLILVAFSVLLLVSLSSATVVEQKIGPFDISFDLTNTSMQLNSSASYWDESFPAAATGVVYIVPKSKPSHEMAHIMILHNAEHNGMLYDPDGLETSLEAEGLLNVQTYTRTIDGNRNGALTISETTDGRKYYLAEYRLDENTLVEVSSMMPMDGGTGDLLNTIHVGKAVVAS